MSKMMNGPIKADSHVENQKTARSWLTAHPSSVFRNLFVLMQRNQMVPAHLRQVDHSNIDEAAFPQKARPILRKRAVCSRRRCVQV